MSERFLRARDVAKRTGLSRPTIYREMGLGDFPKPIRLTERTVAWRESDVEAWMKNRLVAAGRVPGGEA